MKNRTGIILAGGKGSRLDYREKGLIDIHGKAVIEYVIDALKPNVSDILIVSNNPAYQKFNYPVYEDIIKDFGPMSGIYTGLNYSKTDENFILACDLPLIKSSFFDIFENHIDTHDIVVPVTDSFTHVLSAFYRRKIMIDLKQSMDEGIHKIRRILEKFNTEKIDLDIEMYQDKKEMLFNMNTASELDEIVRKISNDKA